MIVRFETREGKGRGVGTQEVEGHMDLGWWCGPVHFLLSTIGPSPSQKTRWNKPLFKLILNFQTQFHTFPNNTIFLISISISLSLFLCVFVVVGHQSHSCIFVPQTLDISSLSLILPLSKLGFMDLLNFLSIFEIL